MANICTSDDVRKMNSSLSKIFGYFSSQLAINEAELSQEIATFYELTQRIRRELAAREVADVNYLQLLELNRIRETINDLKEFDARLDQELMSIDEKLRGKVELASTVVSL